MTAYMYTIELTSDAEPGTGLGSEMIDSLVPRDSWHRPVIQASHVKGLMREAFRDISRPLGWSETLETQVFGQPGESRPGVDAAFRLTDAVVAATPKTPLVTRTSVEHGTGVAKDQSLRTTESIPLGTVFSGEVYSTAEPGSIEELTWRLALLAISAVGASRNRGCGACIVSLEGATENPGALLQMLHERLQTWTSEAAPDEDAPAVPTSLHPVSTEAAVLHLAFRARTPICCPEVADKTNVIKSGFPIPASAVQGVILNRLNATDAALATAVFASDQFRAWPLLPCWAAPFENAPWPDSVPVPIRVSLTHRVAKFSLDETYQAQDFVDAAMTDYYDWTQARGGVPMKTADGVLLQHNGTVSLWRGTDMPRVITAHGVRRDPNTQDGRNLFTVDAMAPMLWQGLVVMPKDAAQRLMDSLAQDPVVAFGKGRTVRGIGELRATLAGDAIPEWQIPAQGEHTVLVVQSPLLLPDAAEADLHAEQEFTDLARSWATQYGLFEARDRMRAWANVGLHFGWSRHAANQTSAGRLPSTRVVLPGSVIKFGKRLDASRLATALQAGMGEGRQRGFGALSVHPGTATALYKPQPEPQTLTGVETLQDAVKLVLEMRRMAPRLPRPSQIRAVQQHISTSETRAARAYLKQQTERTSRIWFTWEPIYAQMDHLLERYPQVASQALDVLVNLAIADQK